MRISELRLTYFRNLEHVGLQPGPGLNWLHGANGAGKTSVLEAIYLLGRGRSFRTANLKHLIQDGADSLTVFCRTNSPDNTLGMERSRDEWRGRLSGRACQRVSEFAEAMPLVLADPSNHQLVEGGPNVRRAFLDWGLFHVEPGHLQRWRRYNRLLQQRNAALKARAADSVLAAIEAPMGAAARVVDQARCHYVELLTHQVSHLQDQLQWRFSPITLHYSAESIPEYQEAWKSHRDRDREHGFTRDGPHRADLKLRANERLAAPRLSRGQQKLTALLLQLAQLEVALESGQRPLLLLDDPVSELDRFHLGSVLEWVGQRPTQAWVTAVEAPDVSEATVFHVEHGKISSA